MKNKKPVAPRLMNGLRRIDVHMNSFKLRALTLDVSHKMHR